ncbi:MAG: DUF3352 domain-containing protein [Gemmatimonadota bacterium]|nr:DUF3352 domain-containing protein [Gemmatimonadota bacterium]
MFRPLTRPLAAVVFAVAIVLACGGDEPTNAAEKPAGIETEAVATELPAGARVVVSGHDLASFWSRLQGTRLYTEVTAVRDVQELKSEAQAAELCVEPDEATVMNLLGEDFDLGYYGQRENDEPDLLLVAEVEDEARVREIVERCEQQLVEEKGATFRDEEYAGESIRVGTSDEGEAVLFYRLGDDRLTIATTRTRIQQAIDLEQDDAAEAMVDVEAYDELVEKLSDATIVAYVDQEALRLQAREAMPDTLAAEDQRQRRLAAATSLIDELRLADATVVGIYWVESGIRGDAFGRFPEEGERSELVKLLAKEPGEIRTLGFQPVGTLLYGAITTLDAELLYDELYRYAIEATRVQMDVANTPDSARADSVVAAQLEAFESRTGIDVEEEVVAWIGEEAAFAITGVDKTGFFPIPEVAFTIGTTDPQTTRTFFTELEGTVAEMARAQASIPLQWQEEQYEGRTIRYAPTPMGEGLSVAYTVGEEFAVLASSRGLVKRMLDARAGRAEALPANPDFAAMTEFYPQRVSTLGFVNLEGILTEVEGLMGSLGQMGGQASAADTTDTARQLIAALKNAPRLGVYSESSGSGVTGHFLLEVN